MKPLGYPIVEFFDKGVGFCWGSYRNLGSGYTCADSIMGSFVDAVGTITPFTAFDKRGIRQPPVLGGCLISPMRGFGLCTVLLIE